MSNNTPLPPLITALLERLQGDETLEMEFKYAQGGLPSSVWETVSAFANTNGGWIILGIKQKDRDLIIEGLPNPTKTLDDFHSIVRNPLKISHPICGAQDATIESWDNKQIIIIRVPQAPRQYRPVCLNKNPYLGTYVRRNSGDYLCTKPEVDRMMREASSVGSDSAILPKFDLSDIDKDSLARYRRLYQTLHPAEARATYEDLRFIESIGGYARSREEGQEGLTVAGLLLLGTDQAIREWRSRHLIDYRLVLNESNAEQRWDDRVAWEGNIFSAFENIYPRLIRGLNTTFHLQGATRVDESAIHIVLREALVNLLVHADYAEQEASLIMHTPSNFVFRNPGSSRVSEFELLHGDRSDPRNPGLVRMFRYIGWAEEAGSGIPKIIQAWRKLGLEMPKIDTGTERYEFILSLRQAHLFSIEDRRWLRTLGSKWEEAEQVALVHTKHYGHIDNATLSRLTGMHPADVSKILVGLRNKGYLQIIGWGRYARYELASEPIIQSVKLPGKPAPIPPNVWNELLTEAKTIREQGRVQLSILKELIMSLCSQVPLSTDELSTLVGRSKIYVKQVVGEMINSGDLEFLYPSQPSTMFQKYVKHTNAKAESPTQLTMEW